MHASSYRKMELFVETYLSAAADLPLQIIDFGSQQVNPLSLTYRTLLDRSPWTYTGLDIAAGHNVTLQIDDAYDWSEVPADSVDVVVSGHTNGIYICTIDGRLPGEAELTNLDKYFTPEELEKKAESLVAEPISEYWFKVFKTNDILGNLIKFN